MDLRSVQKQWDAFGRKDPLWAVLTVGGKEGGRWSLEEFLETGRVDVAAVLRTAADRGLAPRLGRALDFGCGVGRLTQALAETFARADGVDIAPSMIDKAQKLNRFPARCFFHLNDQPDLRLFEDGSFDLVYSTLVLQHMDPSDAKRYIAEFVRVCAPGGLVVFQVPSHRTAVEPAKGASASVGAGPLPREARRCQIIAAAPTGPLAAGSHPVLDVTVRNLGRERWPAAGQDDARYQVALGSHWLTPSGHVVEANGPRAPLPHDIGAGDEVTLLLGLTVPRWNGTYDLVLDMVQEHVAWFGAEGGETRPVRIEVTGGEAPPEWPRPKPSLRPLRERRPGLHRLARLAGLVASHQWLIARRDAGHAFLRQSYERWKRSRGATAMAMNAIVRAEVVDVVAAAGGEVRHADFSTLAGGIRSGVYWVQRRR